MRYLLLIFGLMMSAPVSWAQSPITIYLAGDSTMAGKLPDKRPETGWGEMLPTHFQPDRVKIENHAQNGRSTRTFIAENRWETIVTRLKAGDYVFIQFGHNDGVKTKAAYTPPHDYRRNLIRFIQETRERSAHPVLLTPVVRRRFDETGRFYDTHGEYPEIVRSVAAEYHVPLIDMQRQSAQLLSRYGVNESRKLFLQLKPDEHANYPEGIEDNTHFSPHGASVMAELAVKELRSLNLDLAKYLKGN